MKYPTVSIITPTLNNEKTIGYFLQSLTKQTYSKAKIEILIIDGGSKDKTLKIANRYNTRVIKNPLVLAEPGIDIGMRKAKGELLMILATDNLYKDKDAIRKMVGVFTDSNIYAAFPKHESENNDTLFTKYTNTFTDPFNHFIYGYAANARTFKKVYKTLEYNKIYSIYDYQSSSVKPMIAFAQGFTIRSNFSRSCKEKFDDIKPIMRLIKENEKIAYVHSVSLYHRTVRSLDHFFHKQRWGTRNALEKKEYGIAYRMDLLSPWQKIKIFLWPFYAFSFIIPLLRAFLGFVEDKELIWLFHPVICFISAIASLVEFINFKLNIQQEVSRL